MADFGSLAPDFAPDVPPAGGEDVTARLIRIMRARQAMIDPLGQQAGQAVMPNATGLLSQPQPAQNMPTAPGKVPSMSPWNDARIPGAMMEVGGMLPAVGAARALPAGARIVEDVAANAGSALAAAQPKTLAAILGTAGAMGAGPAMGGDIEANKQTQIMLRDAGHYQGPIDGIIKPGGPTERALKEFRAAEEKRKSDELEQNKVKALQEGAAAQKAAAQAQIEAAHLQSQNIKYKQEGGERLKQMEGEVPWYRQALRDYGAPIGLALGTAAGIGTRVGVTAASNKLSQAAARRAEGMFENDMSGIPARSARLNEFYRKGGAAPGQEPYLPTPTESPGVGFNPNSRPMGELYQPKTAANRLTDVGIPAAFGADAIYGQTVLAPQAHAELERAQKAASDDPSEVNIRALQSAKDRVAIMDTITNVGRAGAMAYPGAAMKIKRSPTVPAMDRAQSEQLLFDRVLRAAVARQAGG